MKGQAKLFDTLALGLLLASLVWAPWPLGSNRPWALALLGMLVWLGVAAALAGRVAAGGGPRRLAVGWAVPSVAILAYAGLVALQLVPGLGPAGGPVSIDPFSTQRYLFTALVYAGAWALVLLVVNSRERAGMLLGAVLAAGVLQAAAAVALYSGGASYTLFFAEFDQGSRTMGTFVNPDHLAGYMELTLAAGLGWLVAQFVGGAESTGTGWRAKVVRAMSFMLSPKMLMRLMLVILVIALVMTRSRMGNGAFLLSLFLLAALVAIRSRRLRRPALWLVASMAVVDVLIIGQYVGLDRVVQRIKDTPLTNAPPQAAVFGQATTAAPPPREESLQQRLEVPTLSLQLVAQRPWLGHGGGSFYTAVPPIKNERLSLYWDHAHNDYVQVASDTGLVGLALWLTVGLATAWRAWRLLPDGQGSTPRGAGVAALMALMCMGLHSVVDFNLHIPANALTFTVLLALVWALPEEGRGPHQGRPAWLWPLAVLAWGVAAWMLVEGQRMLRADLASAGARQQVVLWVAGIGPAPSTAQWEGARADIQRSIDLQPRSPEWQERMGDVFSVAGQINWQNGELRVKHFKAAAGYYEAATALRPSEPGTWAMLSAARQAAGEPLAKVHAAWTQANTLGPYEGHVQPILMQVALGDWDNASPAMQKWASDLFERSDANTRNAINAMAGRYGLLFTPSAPAKPP
jgi:O-antigen ligase